MRLMLFGQHEVCSRIGAVFVPPGRPMAMVGLVYTAEARGPDMACGPDGRLFVSKVFPVARPVPMMTATTVMDPSAIEAMLPARTPWWKFWAHVRP